MRKWRHASDEMKWSPFSYFDPSRCRTTQRPTHPTKKLCNHYWWYSTVLLDDLKLKSFSKFNGWGWLFFSLIYFEKSNLQREYLLCVHHTAHVCWECIHQWDEELFSWIAGSMTSKFPMPCNEFRVVSNLRSD